LAHERRRFGYRRRHVLLRRKGLVVNHKRLFRLYREERLRARRRGGKRAIGIRAPMGNVRSFVRRFCEGGLALQLAHYDAEEATLLARRNDNPPGCAHYEPSRAWISVIRSISLRAMR
jgi:HTH-like domain